MAEDDVKTTTAASKKPRTRGATSSQATGTSRAENAASSRNDGATLTCPECGRTFTRAAALGAHRKGAHGIAGTSKQRSAGSGTTRRRRGSGQTGRGRRAAGTRTAARNGSPAVKGLDRDALLQMVFPNGVPARGEALSAVGSWLDEAERLARIR